MCVYHVASLQAYRSQLKRSTQVLDCNQLLAISQGVVFCSCPLRALPSFRRAPREGGAVLEVVEEAVPRRPHAQRTDTQGSDDCRDLIGHLLTPPRSSALLHTLREGGDFAAAVGCGLGDTGGYLHRGVLACVREPIACVSICIRLIKRLVARLIALVARCRRGRS